MSQTLLLMRHAKSAHGDSSLSDHARPLNERGRRDSVRIARWLSEHQLVPDRILASDSQRTLETAARMNGTWPNAVEISSCESLYLASPESILWTIAESNAKAERLLVLGHNPGTSSVASFLAQSSIQMPTAAVAVFSVTSGAGEESQSPLDRLGRDSACELRSYVTPKSIATVD
ncbi:MAG: histidine phosphatase family protein [Planctomycetota bacterium]